MTRITISKRKLNEYLERVKDNATSDEKVKRKRTTLSLDTILDLESLVNGSRKELVPASSSQIEVKEYSELNITETLEQVLSSGMSIPPDLKIDDRDIKELPNFFQWTMSPLGAGQPAFPRQLELATKMFAEYCPRCTKKRWPKKDDRFGKSFEADRALPVNMKIEDAPEYIQFLEFGKCPCCGATKSELIRNGEMPLPTEFAGAVGQRSGKSALLALMVPYIIHKYLKLQRPIEVFGLMKNSVLTGTVVGLTFQKAVQLLWTPIHNTLKNCIDENSLVTLEGGKLIAIKDIVIGSRVKTLEGVSEVTNKFDNGFQEVFELELENGFKLEATSDHKIRCIQYGRLTWLKVEELRIGCWVVTEEHVTTSKVKRITPKGVKHVYDIEVKGTHNFYANGINVHNCAFFTAYHELLDHYAEVYGEEDLYKFKDTFVSYPHRGLLLHPSGPNKRTLRGDTRFFFCVDELGWFHHGEDDDDKERTSANEVYVSLSNSLKTVRKSSEIKLMAGYNNIPSAYAMNISSPSSYQDKIMTLVRENANNPRVVVFHGATWEYNPLYTKADFAKEYEENYKKADRDYGANPPMSENPFIDNPDHLEESSKNGRKNLVEYQYANGKSPSGQNQRYAVIKKVRSTYSNMLPGIMAIDSGYSNNSFAVACGFVEERDQKLYPTLHTLVEIAPKKNVSVLNYTKIAREVLYPLIEELNVQLFVADRWNSLKLLHDIEDEFGIHTLQYSLRPDDFSFIYDHIVDEVNRPITVPKPEIPYHKIIEIELDDYPHCFGPGNKYTGKPMPVAHFLHQAQTVSVNARGMVDKGAGYTDDLFRAASLFLHHALDKDIVDQYGLLTGAVEHRKRSVGVMVSGSSGGGQRSGSSSCKVGAVAGSGSAVAGGSSVFVRK